MTADEPGSGFRVSEVEITDEDFVGVEDDFAQDGFASERVGNTFAVVINQAIGFEDEIIENRQRRLREDDGGDALDVLVGFVAEFGDLLKVIGAGKSIEVELVGGATFVGLDTDGAELSFELGEGADRDDAVVGAKIIIGVVFDAVTAMNAIGDGEGIKKDGVAGDFGKVFG